MINTPILENERVILSPLTIDNYKKLIPIASQEKLAQYSPSDIETPNSLKNYVEIALQQLTAGTSMPFIIYDRKHDAFAGSTRFMHINRKNRVLHIGSTWIGREFQGTGLNTQMKQLMLAYAFRTLDFEKVEFRVDERNLRSRKAVEKLGCTLEGILRKDVYLLDGFKRNTCCYGILREEWSTTNQ
ncbi:GNAT family N-acetyltransferase [Maribacter ulvicola]|uniref:Protein N-acetyltransferase, RimJ/RimL family n=1 Tax=Maribacter ulvicola TaxID=228959 RepID=A0A1N6VFA6_9FLAO|nr:GNAT family N-acetyltransferase [Maribacter ulvicola]SIQ76447.1 Protein N-acetyltransferase, RimJ/RimL family [Maribacter ulvicola]